jgi:hypothetical protein
MFIFKIIAVFGHNNIYIPKLRSAKEYNGWKVFNFIGDPTLSNMIT